MSYQARLFILFVGLIQLNTTCFGQLHPVKSNNLWGLINNKGVLVVPFQYEAISEFKESGKAIAQKNGKMGLIDASGRLVIECKYDFLNIIGEDLYYIRQNDHWNVINQREELILKDMVGKIDLLPNGYLSYNEISGKGLAHRDKGIILPPVYQSFELADSAYIIAKRSDVDMALFDTAGQQILADGFETIRIEDHHIWGFRSGKWGAYNHQGKPIIQPAWTNYRAMNTNFAELIDENGVHHLYSFYRGKIIHSKMRFYQLFQKNYCKIHNFYDKVGLIDLEGTIVVKDSYLAVTNFGDQTFRIKNEEGIGIIDGKGTILQSLTLDYIGPLDSHVALARKDDKWGIVNLRGQRVLPFVHDENLILSQNLAKYKHKNGELQMFVFDESGNLTENNQFNNLKSLRIRKKLKVNDSAGRNSNNTAASNPNQISDSLVFRFHGKARLWGLWNLDSARYKFAPQWSAVTVYKDLGITIVEKADRKIGGEMRTGFINLEMQSVYGLFTNVHGLPISKMEFLDIRISDLTALNNPVARCIFIGGSHGLMARNGRVIARGFAFIGDFIEGKARATRKGNIRIDVDEKIKRPLSNTIDYFRNLMSRYSYESGSLEKWIDVFENQGFIYVKDAKWGYIDSTGILHSDFRYDFATNYSNGRAMVCNEGAWGMIDEIGNEIIKPLYDNIDFLPKSDRKLFFISQNIHLKGALDDHSKIIVPVNYTKIRSFKDNLIAVRNIYRRWGFVNRSAQEVIPATFRQANDFSEGLAVVYHQSKWGAINSDGAFEIEPIYSQMGNFKEGKAWVRLKNGKKGYINKDGAVLFAGAYSKLTDFKDSVARVYIRKKGWGLIDVQGNYILKPQKRFSRIEPFNDYGIAKVKIGNKYRLINREGKFLGKQSYGTIRPFVEGYAVIRKQAMSGFHLGKRNLNYTFIDTLGQIIGQEEYRQLKPFSEGRAAYRNKEGKWGYLNYKGEAVVNPKYFRAEAFKNNRAIVWQSYNKTGVIDRSAKVIIPIKYNKIIDIQENLALVRQNSWTYFFVRENTKRNSPENYQGAFSYNHGLAPVKQNQKWGIVNNKGLTTVIPKYGQIQAYENGIAQVEVSRLVGVVDIKGKVIIPPTYEYVSYIGDGLFRVENGDKVGYLNIKGDWVWAMQ